ncbi:DUF3015 domain-containing protein [Candidatus Nitrospira bockiana]
MKRGLLAMLIVSTVAVHSPIVWAANPDTGPGCGLGKLAWGDFKGQKQIAPQVMMATTNGTFGSQTFGISFGTSGCTNNGVIMRTELVNAFASATYESLSQEMAQGHGEHLTSLATLLEIPAEQQPEFFAVAQANYRTIMQAEDQSPSAMVKSLQAALAAHPTLGKTAD